MAFTYKVERASEIVNELKHLFELHWEEIANYKSEIPLKPDYGKYQILEDKNCLLLVTCRNNENSIVGYSLFFISNHIHYQSCVVAGNDLLFLHKDYRKGRVGINLIKESERFLKEMGVQKITWHIKPNHDFSPILVRMGYMQEEFIMGKLLGE